MNAPFSLVFIARQMSVHLPFSEGGKNEIDYL